MLLRQYWRGPTWINAAWLLWLGLVRYGYRAEAAELAARIARAVHGAGLREYYDPYTGEGMGATHFSWSSLVMELVDPDPGAETSHLGVALESGSCARSSSSANAASSRAAPATVERQRFSGRSERQW